MTSHLNYVLIGQGNWVRKLAEGLRDTGFPVQEVPLDSARSALNWEALRRIRAADVVVRVGFRPGARTWRGRAFDGALRIFGRRAISVCYWIGTDVLNFTDDLSHGAPAAGWRSPALAVDHHLAGSEPLHGELAKAGIAASVVGFPWRTVQAPTDPPPFPEQFTVLTYIPDGRAEFYGGPVVLEAARRLPGICFEVMGGEGIWAEDPPENVHFRGWVRDPAEAYASSSCVLRIVRHDSIGGTAVEGLLFGRPVLYSQELDHTMKVEPTPESVTQALKELSCEWKAGRLNPSAENARWASRTFDPTRRFELLGQHLAEISGLPRPPRLSYITLQATTEGQAAHAHVHEIVKGLAAAGWSVRLLKPKYGQGSPSAASRLVQFGLIQGRAITSVRRGDAFYIRSHFAAWPAALLAKVLRVPVVQEVNGPHEDALVAWPGLRRIRPLVERANRSQMRSADAVITVTPQLVRWLRLDAGVERGHLVSNGADVELFTPHAPRREDLPDRYVVFFGALAPWQGIDIALEAASSQLWPEDVSLVVVGDGQLRDLVERKSDGSHIIYLGRQPYAEIPGLVAASLVSLLPMASSAQDRGQNSTRDHTTSGLAPLKLFESMACGVPVIASDLPGMAETISSADCGILVEPGSAMSLAEAVRQIANDPARAAEMGRHGRESAVDEHSWRSRAADTAEVLTSVVSRSSLHHATELEEA
ncbi:glycosyltransferase [Terracoccus sp. 273MFTsu3.1]|uniref:glycosyltransferase n=1 Tax=Terracoccus sp. 273MFTsu3.1 TaxID=1172188 RepID=UPI0003AA8751|nr:glycosyltransferase [Terracoccus sp. 273MFTsu3.1]